MDGNQSPKRFQSEDPYGPSYLNATETFHQGSNYEAGPSNIESAATMNQRNDEELKLICSTDQSTSSATEEQHKSRVPLAFSTPHCVSEPGVVTRLQYITAQGLQGTTPSINVAQTKMSIGASHLSQNETIQGMHNFYYANNSTCNNPIPEALPQNKHNLGKPRDQASGSNSLDSAFSFSSPINRSTWLQQNAIDPPFLHNETLTSPTFSQNVFQQSPLMSVLNEPSYHQHHPGSLMFSSALHSGQSQVANVNYLHQPGFCQNSCALQSRDTTQRVFQNKSNEQSPENHGQEKIKTYSSKNQQNEFISSNSVKQANRPISIFSFEDTNINVDIHSTPAFSKIPHRNNDKDNEESATDLTTPKANNATQSTDNDNESMSFQIQEHCVAANILSIPPPVSRTLDIFRIFNNISTTNENIENEANILTTMSKSGNDRKNSIGKKAQDKKSSKQNKKSNRPTTNTKVQGPMIFSPEYIQQNFKDQLMNEIKDVAKEFTVSDFDGEANPFNLFDDGGTDSVRFVSANVNSANITPLSALVLKDREIDRLQNKINQLITDKNKLLGDVKELKSANTDFETKVKHYKNDINKLYTEKNLLTEKLGKDKMKLEKAIMLQDAMFRLSIKYNQLHEENKSLRAENKQLAKDMDALFDFYSKKLKMANCKTLMTQNDANNSKERIGGKANGSGKDFIEMMNLEKFEKQEANFLLLTEEESKHHPALTNISSGTDSVDFLDLQQNRLTDESLHENTTRDGENGENLEDLLTDSAIDSGNVDDVHNNQENDHQYFSLDSDDDDEDDEDVEDEENEGDEFNEGDDDNDEDGNNGGQNNGENGNEDDSGSNDTGNHDSNSDHNQQNENQEEYYEYDPSLQDDVYTTGESDTFENCIERQARIDSGEISSGDINNNNNKSTEYVLDLSIHSEKRNEHLDISSDLCNDNTKPFCVRDSLKNIESSSFMFDNESALDLSITSKTYTDFNKSMTTTSVEDLDINGPLDLSFGNRNQTFKTCSNVVNSTPDTENKCDHNFDERDEIANGVLDLSVHIQCSNTLDDYTVRDRLVQEEIDTCNEQQLQDLDLTVNSSFFITSTCNAMSDCDVALTDSNVQSEALDLSMKNDCDQYRVLQLSKHHTEVIIESSTETDNIIQTDCSLNICNVEEKSSEQSEPLQEYEEITDPDLKEGFKSSSEMIIHENDKDSYKSQRLCNNKDDKVKKQKIASCKTGFDPPRAKKLRVCSPLQLESQVIC